MRQKLGGLRALATIRSMSFAMLFVGSIACAQTPIAGWQLDEGSGTTTADWSGHSKTGALVNGPAWTTGHSGNALTFDGTDEYVQVDGSGPLANLYTSGLTVSAWIKPVVIDGRIVDKNNDDFGGWFLKLEDGVVQFVSNAFDVAPVLRSSADLIATDTWQHVVATWDGSANASGAHVYVNGISSDGSGAGRRIRWAV